jgi:hypothetical protein
MIRLKNRFLLLIRFLEKLLGATLMEEWIAILLIGCAIHRFPTITKPLPKKFIFNLILGSTADTITGIKKGKQHCRPDS